LMLTTEATSFGVIGRRPCQDRDARLLWFVKVTVPRM
jgi:hypothetical protein